MKFAESIARLCANLGLPLHFRSGNVWPTTHEVLPNQSPPMRLPRPALGAWRP
jgi:hypothetical protein